MLRNKSGTPLAQQATKLQALRITSSTYGLAVPILFGTQRMGAKLLDYTDFEAIAHTSSQEIGGKGTIFGGGARRLGSTSYTYQAAVALLLCEGPIEGVLNVWDTAGKSDSQVVTETWVVPASGATPVVVTHNGDFYFDVGVEFQSTENQWINDQWNSGLVVPGDPTTGHYITFENLHGLTRVTGSPGPGQYQVNTGSYFFNVADAGKVITITYAYAAQEAGQPPTATYNFTGFFGSQPQSPWSYMVGAHPERALSYPRLAYMAAAPMQLGTAASLPNLSFEVVGMRVFPGHLLDASPRDILHDVLTDFFVGAGLDPAALDANTDLQNYCQANDVLISLLIDSQRQVSDIVTEVCEVANCAPVYADGLLKLIPFSEVWAAGNGAVYQPDTTPAYDLDNDDFIVSSPGQPPVRIEERDIREDYNSVRIEFMNRALDYNPDIMPDFDQAHIDVYGLRTEDPQSYHSITRAIVAKTVASNRVKRNCYIDPKVYRFTLSPRYVRVLPMCLVTLTESHLGLNKLPVRLTAVEEDDKGNLACEAEPFPFATATASLYPKQIALPVNVNPKSDPGNTNPPVIFEYPDSLSSAPGQYLMGLAVSGSGQFWGGCNVWVSFDNVTYKQVAQTHAASRMGALTADFPIGSDPDVTHTLSLDVSESHAVLLSGTTTDRDALRNLCYLDIGSGGTVGPNGVTGAAESAVANAVVWSNPINIAADDASYAVATIDSTAPVASLSLTAGGSGYTSAPAVVFSGGGGSGASAICTIDAGGAITHVSIASGGTGYFVGDELGLIGADCTLLVTATSSHIEGIAGSIRGVSIEDGGAGNTIGTYDGDGGSGSGAQFNVTSISGTGAVTSITLTSGGSVYTSAPTVSFSGGGGSGATATATLGSLASLTYELAATNPNPALTPTAQLVGVKVEVKGHQSAATASGITAQLTVDGITGVGSIKALQSLGTSDAYLTFGGATDVWGTSLNGSQVNASTFGVLMQGQLNGGARPITFSLTYARFTFYYTLPVAIGEFISFATASLTSTDHYNLTSFRRGVFGTNIEDHPSGSNFVRVDENVVQIPFSAQDVGKTVYIKLTSFNIWGLSEQNIANVMAYSFVLHGFFNNVLQVVGNDATTDWDPASWTGSTWTGRVYGKTAGTPTPGAAVNFQRADSTTFAKPAATFPGLAPSTLYWVLFNPYQQSFYILSSYAQVLSAQGNGHMVMGAPFTTPNGAGTGGIQGGGGGQQGGVGPDKPGGYLA